MSSQDSEGCSDLADSCVPTPPGSGGAPEPRAAVEGAVGGQPQPVARPFPWPAGPCAGAALPLGPPDAHPLGHGEALGAPAAIRAATRAPTAFRAPVAPGTPRGALGPEALRLEPPPTQGSDLRSIPQLALPPRRGLGAPLVAGPQALEPLRRRLGLGVGAGLGRLGPAPPRPTLPCPSPLAAPEASGRVQLPPQPAWLRLLRPGAHRGEVRVPAGARPPVPAPDAVCL